MAAILGKEYTVEEYFELEKTSEIRHEYILGKLLPMSGGTKSANKITLNTLMLLDQILEARKLEIFAHDIKVMVKKGKRYHYPDLVVAPESDDESIYLVTQPVLIAEVISKGTAYTDRGDKLREYCALPTLQYYLIIEQEKAQIELYTRDGDRWVVSFFSDLKEEIDLEVFETKISLETIYRRVKF